MALTTTSVDELRGREAAAFARFLAVVTEAPSTTLVGDGAGTPGRSPRTC